MGNPRKTQELTLKILKGHETKSYKYQKPIDLIAEEQFEEKVCRKTRNSDGNQVPLLDKQGNKVFYQLQYFLDSEVDVLNEDQKHILLQDPRFKDPVTGRTKVFPYKILLSVTRVLTEADGKEWLMGRWAWEGMRRDKDIEVSPSFVTGIYDHPFAETALRQDNPNDKDSPYRTIITASNYKPVYEVPFSGKAFEEELAKRNAPKDERHIQLTLQKIGTSGIKYPHTYEVTDKEQFLTCPFNELWDYLASAPLRDASKTKMGMERQADKNQQYG